MTPELRDDDPGRVNPQVLLAMLEVWGTVDTVFREPDAFSNPRVELGRIHRSYLRARRIWAETPVVTLGATSPDTDSRHPDSDPDRESSPGAA